MSLSTLLLLVVGKGFLQNFKTMGQAQSRSEVAVRIQNALESLSRDARVADPVVSGDAQNLTVKLFRSGHCLQRSWSLSGRTMTSTTLTYPSTCGSGTPTTRVNANFLSNVNNNATGTAVFTYQDRAGASTTAPSAAQVSIRLVGSATGGGPVSLQTAVQIRNAT